jgi:hypothetical protein
MRIADLDYLLAHDSQTEWEAPKNFDYEEAMAEVRSLGPDLAAISGHSLKLDDQIQDASFFADWIAYEDTPRPCPGVSSGAICTILCIRFSAFGRMYSIWGNSDLFPINDETRHGIIDHLACRDFVFVPDTLLDLPYHRTEIAPDWQIRYFNYL